MNNTEIIEKHDKGIGQFIHIYEVEAMLNQARIDERAKCVAELERWHKESHQDLVQSDGCVEHCEISEAITLLTQPPKEGGDV